jgi:hypothetical protein
LSARPAFSTAADPTADDHGAPVIIRQDVGDGKGPLGRGVDLKTPWDRSNDSPGAFNTPRNVATLRADVTFQSEELPAATVSAPYLAGVHVKCIGRCSRESTISARRRPDAPGQIDLVVFDRVPTASPLAL